MANNHEKVEDEIQRLRTKKYSLQNRLEKARVNGETEKTVSDIEVEHEMVKADLEKILVRFR